MADGERTVVQLMVSASLARRLIEAGAKKGAELGKAFTIAIVDGSGVLKALERMDGAPLVSVQVAQDKAYTAVGFGISTAAWHDFIKDDPPLLHGIVHTPRLVVFGGGYPLNLDGGVAGGIGVSGGHYHQDMQVAEAALAALR